MDNKIDLSKKTGSFDWKLLLGILLVIVLGLISLSVGAYDILNGEDGLRMLFVTRLPRTISLMLAGAAMSLSGLIMQLITQNKFVEPTTTGTLEWAGLGLILVYVLVPSPSLVQRMIGAIIFSFIGTIIFFLVINKIKFKSQEIIPIIGIMIGSVVSALSTFVGLIFNMTHSLEVWFAGSFASVEQGRYEFLWAIVIITFLVYKFADKLTLAGLGEDIATNLGLNYNKIVIFGIGLVALAVGIVSAVIGNIPFLGLIVPNLVSMFRGDNLRSNLPWVCILGMSILTISDLIARVIIRPFEVPVSVVLGILGSFVFIGLILYQRRN